MLTCKSKFAAWMAVLLLGFMPNGVAAQSEFSGTTMGPIAYRVVAFDVADNAEVEQGIQSQLDRVNRLMSTYIPESDVSLINGAEADVWTRVDPLTLTVIEKAIAISELTDGAFDMTVGPAVNRWKFGPDSEGVEFPSDEEVEQMKAYVGYKKISLQEDPPAVRKSDARTYIDLSAIAKGFAVDQVAAYLKDAGLTDFMVEVGGEVFAAGRKPDGPWRIGMDKPKSGSMELAGAIEISDVAVATSGDYRNFRMHDGKKISHTIDPATCRPVMNSTASCSVVAEDCMTADAIATAVMVLGAERGLELCSDMKLAVHVIDRAADGSSEFKVNASDNFPTVIPTSKLQVRPEKSASIWPAFIGAMVIFSLAILGMAVGAIFNQKPIRGSCGGISPTAGEDGEDASCSLCHKPVAECPEKDLAAEA